jgi:hypothetical protein
MELKNKCEEKNEFEYSTLRGYPYFSSVPVLHYLQVVLFLLKFEQFHEYLVQHSLKSGGTKCHFRWVKVPGIAPYCKCI